MITKKQAKATNRKTMGKKTRSEQLKKKNYRRHT